MDNTSYHTMNTRDFAKFGVPIIAYVKPVTIKGHTTFALHSADGTRLEMQESEAMATRAAHMRNLLPVVVH